MLKLESSLDYSDVSYCGDGRRGTPRDLATSAYIHPSRAIEPLCHPSCAPTRAFTQSVEPRQ